MSGDKAEFDDWARACENDRRVRAAWVAEFKLEGWRIVKLELHRDTDVPFDFFTIDDEL